MTEVEGHPEFDQARMLPTEIEERVGKRNDSGAFGEIDGMLFEQAMGQTRMAVCLSDPNLPDSPIVFCNDAFRQLTGYTEDEILGKNCRFLQGPGTDPDAVAKIRETIKAEDVAVIEILNYRKDGTAFWNALHIGPIYNDDGTLKYFFGSQWDVSNVNAARLDEENARSMARELSHRMKNMFSVIMGIVNVTGRLRGIQQEAAEINARIDALGRAYEPTLDEASTGSISIGQSIEAIMAPYINNPGTELKMIGNGARVPFTVVSTMGLLLHELAANAMKHGAWSVDGGSVTLDWSKSGEDGQLLVDWQEHGGPDVVADEIEDGTGNVLMDRILSSGIGTMTKQWREGGLHALITVRKETTS